MQRVSVEAIRSEYERQAEDDRRDRLAMLAAEKIAPSIKDFQGMDYDQVEKLLKDWAQASYLFANSMLAARENTRTKE